MAFLLASISFVVTALVYPRVLSFARRHNIVDTPNARKLQRVPVPVMGGTSIFIGLVVAIIVGECIYPDPRIWIVLALLSAIYFVGVWDDVREVSVVLRFLVELLVVWLMILLLKVEINDFHGLWGIRQIPDVMSVPLSLVAGVGIINAINMIDGVDGYCSSHGVMACATFAVIFFLAGDRAMFALSLIAIGALLPFFFHNVFGRTSKMFLGDGGSLMLGTILTLLVFSTLSSDSPCSLAFVGDGLSLPALVLAILAVPVFDTLKVMIIRMATGQSPFHSDKTHLHHLFIEMCYTHLATSGIIVLMNALIVMALLLVWWLGGSADVQMYVVIALSLFFVWGVYFYLEREHRKNDGEGSPLWNKLSAWGRRSTGMTRTRIWLWVRSVVDSKVFGGSAPKEPLSSGKTDKIDPRV